MVPSFWYPARTRGERSSPRSSKMPQISMSVSVDSSSALMSSAPRSPPPTMTARRSSPWEAERFCTTVFTVMRKAISATSPVANHMTTQPREYSSPILNANASADSIAKVPTQTAHMRARLLIRARNAWVL